MKMIKLAILATLAAGCCLDAVPYKPQPTAQEAIAQMHKGRGYGFKKTNQKPLQAITLAKKEGRAERPYIVKVFNPATGKYEIEIVRPTVISNPAPPVSTESPWGQSSNENE